VINFTPAERIEVDRQYKVLARALHDLDPSHPPRLRSVLERAEAGSTDPTLARVLVAGEILRGVAWEGRAPLTVRSQAMPGELAAALSEAERLGRSISPHALAPKRGFFGLFARRKSFSQAGKEALMRCRAVGAAQERRSAGARSGRGLRRA
jgi:hypothetical protein